MESEEWSECVPFGDGFELPVMENSMEQSGTAKEKSLRFAVRIVKLYQYLCSEKTEYVLSKQVLRSGTSIGANLAEAETAVSKSDFLNKVYIALKECSETLYWLLKETEYLTDTMYQSLNRDCVELKRMLSATTKTMKEPKP